MVGPASEGPFPQYMYPETECRALNSALTSYTELLLPCDQLAEDIECGNKDKLLHSSSPVAVLTVQRTVMGLRVSVPPVLLVYSAMPKILWYQFQGRIGTHPGLI